MILNLPDVNVFNKMFFKLYSRFFVYPSILKFFPVNMSLTLTVKGERWMEERGRTRKQWE